ncbi:lipase family protein [Tuwongella immobilis]|uniref:AB hydrolase-1 domain-containing protein n=1 Tax=Tuwongella immobilis TaxID=692036 RepID=A0A6C2YMQ8_9BACT|nr:alpha/beta hydrolase [Tuwongella immobilis]VIP02355.1 hypothetical protein : Uncharacterized protein OS=Acaryochloris marina (strain MBIC 11017) GN=AM1_D0251 PE=4 SV=1: Abhydrolase_6 [Tuwongella immobilis]VTS01151.1 hypothetical protein : Uncharacterized protein OS=Acaryochloris marina (strain MBIC 11017) GN=AM1_D0251 PE=4 SV=1: Abhydrolase_6 [Tuwongella immobilis]
MSNARRDVLLIHGMGRSPISMMLLGARLRRAGYRPHYFGYWVTIESFDAIVARLVKRLRRFGPRPVAIVAHSLGGLLSRVAVDRLQTERDPTIVRLIQLGTPNQSPRMARWLKPWWLFHWVFGDCGRFLATPERYVQIPAPSLPIFIVAGSIGWYGRISPFGEEPNDGLVAVSEAAIANVPMEVHRATHSLMLFNRHVIRRVQQLLDADFQGAHACQPSSNSPFKSP